MSTPRPARPRSSVTTSATRSAARWTTRPSSPPTTTAPTAPITSSRSWPPSRFPDRRGRSREEVGLGPLQLLSVQGDIDLLVVEGDQSGDGQQLAGREVVTPGQIGMYRAGRPDGPVAAGRALVRARSHGIAGDQVGEVDVGSAQVVAGGQAG